MERMRGSDGRFRKAADVEGVLDQEVQTEHVLDPKALNAFGYLTNKGNYAGKTYDEIMAEDADLDDIPTLEHRRGRQRSEHTLYLADLLVGSKFSDNQFFNEVVNKIGSLPKEEAPDQIVISGLYMGDFGGRKKNSRWMLKNGLRTLDEQFLHGKSKIDQLRNTDIPVVYSLSDNDIDIVEEMTFEAFEQMHALAKQHIKEHEESDDVKRQLSRLEKAKANPKWPEYYRFTQEVAFPYCVRSGRALMSVEGVQQKVQGLIDSIASELENGDLTQTEITKLNDQLAQLRSDIVTGVYSLPEREILFDAYRRQSSGLRLQPKHRNILDINALKDTNGLQVVEDFEMHTKTRGAEYLDLIRHRFQTTKQPVANYFAAPTKIRKQLAADGEDRYDNIILTGQHEAAGVFGTNNEAIHSIGGLQDVRKAANSKGYILTSPANQMGKEVLGRKRFHPASATSIERLDDGTQIVNIYNKHLMEISESLTEPVTIMLQCDWQAGNIASRPDLQIKQLDIVNRRLGQGTLYLALGGDTVEGRNYSDFPRESGRTGLMGMDQQFEFVRLMVEESLEQLNREQMDNLLVKATIGNHEYNSGTLKWNGYSFFEPIIDPYKKAFASRGYTYDEVRDKVQIQDTLVTDKGEPFKTYETVFRIGEIGVSLSHFFGAGRGTGGQPPAFTGLNQTNGLGAVRKDIDVGIFGHYHHASYVVGGNKLYVGAGSLNGITGFEYERGLRSASSIVSLKLAPGRAPQIEIMSEEAINNYKIPDGPFSDKELRSNYGYREDKGFDIGKHTPYLDDRFPKSILQKRVLSLGREAAFSVDRTGMLGKNF
ncbi:hypothetical protein KC949_00015 [Candidatus Saccharibacteria bacterium]|nr:hypothetical protein [Candidatus Saccharibacteria bacterium]